MVDVLFSYSHKDEDLRNRLETHLAMLRREGTIRTWHDRRIGPGEYLHEEIDERLETSSIILLLVSADFLASDYCYEREMKRALERHQAGTCIVVPVILHPCDWHSAPFSSLRATPTDGKPISKFTNMDEAFLEVVRDIRAAAKRVNPSTEVDVGSAPTPVDELTTTRRSSNLRVKKSFSDHERDRFVDESYEYVARFFENSLQELRERNPHIEVRFQRMNSDGFVVAVYSEGRKRAACHVWRNRGKYMGDIAYAATDSAETTSINEYMSVTDDGYVLQLKPMGMMRMMTNQPALTQQGAAEYFWDAFISPLQ